MRSKLHAILTAVLLTMLAVQTGGAAGSLTLTFSSNASGISIGGTGTASASMALGKVQAYGGTVPTGVTKSVNGTTNWTLSTPVNVKVTKSGVTSSSYSMLAELASSDTTLTWKFGSATLSSTSYSTVTTSGVYSTATPYTFSLTIPFSASARTVNNTIDILVTSN
jgi:hypothetical protein